MRTAIYLYALMATLCLGPALSRGADEAPVAAGGPPALTARFSADETPARTLFFYSPAPLRSVHVKLGTQWVAAEEVDYPHDGAHYHVYRVRSTFAPSANQVLEVNSWTPDGQQNFKYRAVVQNSEAEPRVQVTLDRVRARAEYLAENAPRIVRVARRPAYLAQTARGTTAPVVGAGDPYGFVPLLNRYRQSRGLPPVSYDSALSQQAQVNNAQASPHGYMGSAMVQNWAQGHQSAQEVLQGWINSPGHNRNLLDPNIRSVGIARSGNEWTFNGR